MSYYADKKKAFLLIDEMLREGRSHEEIELKLATRFGFSKKILEQRIEMYKRVNGANK
ncbi:MAG: hypothetical protein KKB31_06000 [Nanoarchaeota archaeon]|nr:hypothetical protein [Nanoarchaeota archaeon]